MEWQDEAIVLSVGRFGEHDAVLDVMTNSHGRARGFVKGGMGRRNKASLQPGNRLSVTWRARLETNLGRFQVELLHSPLGSIIGHGGRMSALSAMLALVLSTMPEREPHTNVYSALDSYISLVEDDTGTQADFASALARVELGILGELGYGLDLQRCAATGATTALKYVSPKSGSAVSESAGEPYKDKLLRLPAFLSPEGDAPDLEQALDALILTGFFLNRSVWIVAKNGQPDARERFVASLQKQVQKQARNSRIRQATTAN